MAIHLVTGKAGTDHVKSENAGSLNAGIIGPGTYFLETGTQLAATMVNANTVRITDGDLSMQGRHVTVEDGDHEDLTVENGTQQQLRHDLVVVRYEKLAQSPNTEKVTLKVIKGTPADSDPQDPEYEAGDIRGGDLVAEEPIWRIPLDGISVGEPERMCATVKSLAGGLRFQQLWSGSVRNPNQPMTIPAPGIGDYSLVLVRGNGMNVLLLRDVGSDPQGGAIRGDSGNYACSITVTEWAQDSITITDYIYSSHSNPTLGGTVTRNAGDWMTITGIWGVA